MSMVQCNTFQGFLGCCFSLHNQSCTVSFIFTDKNECSTTHSLHAEGIVYASALDHLLRLEEQLFSYNISKPLYWAVLTPNSSRIMYRIDVMLNGIVVGNWRFRSICHNYSKISLSN